MRRNFLRCRSIGLAWVLLASAGLPAQAGLFSDPDPNWQEQAAELPAMPHSADLIPLAVPARAGQRLFIDARSLEVGADGVVRYTLLVQSASGAENLTREGLHCARWSWRLYARAEGGQWRLARPPSPQGSESGTQASPWQPLGEGAGHPYRMVLARDYFCEGGVPPVSREQALKALREDRSPRGH